MPPETRTNKTIHCQVMGLEGGGGKGKQLLKQLGAREHSKVTSIVQVTHGDTGVSWGTEVITYRSFAPPKF